MAGMCGRYAASRNPDDLVEEFEVDAPPPEESLQPDYNVAPTKKVYAVLTRADGGLRIAKRLGGNRVEAVAAPPSATALAVAPHTASPTREP